MALLKSGYERSMAYTPLIRAPPHHWAAASFACRLSAGNILGRDVLTSQAVLVDRSGLSTVHRLPV